MPHFTLRIKQYYITALVISFSCWLLLLLSSGAFYDGYHLVDDHEFASIYYDLDIKKIGLIKSILEWLQNDHVFGRFRPVYYIHRILIIKILGFNLFALSVYNLFLAGFSTFFLFIFAKKLGFTFTESLLFSFFNVLGLQSEVWWQLGPAETLGTFFLSVTLMCLVFSVLSEKFKAIWKFLFCFFTILMSLTKESFSLIIPVMIFINVWFSHDINNLSWHESFKKNSTLIVFLSFFFSLEIAYIKYFVGTDFGYAGYEGFHYLKFFQTLNSINQYVSGWLILLSLILVILVARVIKNQSYIYIAQKLYKPFAAFILVLLPQLLLYSKSGMSDYRYLLPVVFGYALLILFITDFLKTYKTVSVLFLLILSLNLCGKFYLAWNNSFLFSNSGKITTALLNTLEMNTQPESKILIVADPTTHQQWILSLKRYLKYIARRNHLYLNDEEFKDFRTTLLNPKRAKIFEYYHLSSELTGKNQFDCVVILTPDLNKKFTQKAENSFVIDKFKLNIFKAATSPNSVFKIYLYTRKVSNSV
ncbi:hypothetical protein H6F96_25565 [Microcoleus sp. FACHB-53]|nr:hypothetical protein [Microcoleus sp. FACHB-53]